MVWANNFIIWTSQYINPLLDRIDARCGVTGSELPWFKEKVKKDSVTALNWVSNKRKELLVDASATLECTCRVQVAVWVHWLMRCWVSDLKTCGVMSLNTFSHTFHYVTHYTDPDPITDINIPQALHLTDTCRKLDFEICQDLCTNTGVSEDGGWCSHELACRSDSRWLYRPTSQGQVSWHNNFNDPLA